jgi:hypothetical protein
MDGMIAQFQNRFSPEDGRGLGSRLVQTFFKFNGQSWWTDANRSSIALAMSHHLALQMGTPHASLDADLRRVLSLYRIGEREWSLLQRTTARMADGREYVVPDQLRSLDDGAIRRWLGDPGASDAQVRRAREDIEGRLRSYFLDRTDIANTIPDPATRSILLGDSRAGTGWGELRRMVGQFKAFPVQFVRSTLGRELYGRGDATGQWHRALFNGNGEVLGLAEVFVALTLLGYGTMTVKDLLRGKEPRIPTDGKEFAKVFLASALQGGGLGLFGDFLFGEASRTGGGPFESALGPVLGSAGQLISGWQQLIHGEPDKGADRLSRLAITHVPFANLFYAKAALDYLILFRIQEWMNPGYLTRMEQRMRREDGQEFFFPPSRAIPYGG